jgi:outer membrane protein assembly factor BamB
VRIPEPEVGLARSPGSARGRLRSSRKLADGRVYLASAYGSGPGGGVLMALSAASGELLWRFNTLLGPDSGVEAVGLGSGGAWETPLVSSDDSSTMSCLSLRRCAGGSSPCWARRPGIRRMTWSRLRCGGPGVSLAGEPVAAGLGNWPGRSRYWEASR